MPYKTDGIPFELHPRPTKGEDGKPLLYARPQSRRGFDTEYLDNFCAKYRGMQRGEMKRMFETFCEVAARWIANGYRVETPIGSFSAKLKLLGDFTNPDDVQSRHVIYDGLEFTPSKLFKKEVLNPQHGCHKVKNRVGNAQMYDQEAMSEALRQSMYHGYPTIAVFRAISGLKYNSAKKYLDSLCEGDAPMLRRYKEGGTFHYECVPAQPSTQE